MREHQRLSCFVLLCASAVWAQSGALELDLSPTASLKGVLVLPPVATVVTGQKRGFVGLDTRKAVERFQLPAHQKLVSAFDRRLSGKVVPADVAMGLLNKEGITPSTLNKSQTVARLAQAAQVEWVLTFTLSKANALIASINDSAGNSAGEPSVITDVTTLSDAQADALANLLAPRLLELEKDRLKAEEEKNKALSAPPLPAPEEQLVDVDLEAVKKESGPFANRSIDKNRVRALVAVGPGATLRSLEVSGDAAHSLAELTNGTVIGLGFNAQLMPLEFFDATSAKAWSQVSLEAHYRRAFVHAQGESGNLEGQSCTMTDDDLQLRVGARYRLGEGYLPTIGLATGWSQEQTRFDCSLPLLSTTWSGVDAQLRVRQPLFRDIVTLELIGGPRFLLSNAPGAAPGLSVSGEAWVEVKPYSILFARAGGRFSRLQATMASLAAVDTRSFLSLEIGAFF